MTLGQLDTTRCYSMGERPVAFLREPLPQGTYYVSDTDLFTWDSCASPYDVSPDAPLLKPGTTVPQSPVAGSRQVTWITTILWSVAEGIFSVQADLEQVVEDNGPGVYTVLVWGEADGEDVALSNYSIFVQ